MRAGWWEGGIGTIGGEGGLLLERRARWEAGGERWGEVARSRRYDVTRVIANCVPRVVGRRRREDGGWSGGERSGGGERVQGRAGGEDGERKEGRMAVISATRTRKRILATLLASPRGPFRDPPPVTTHSFPFSSLGPSIRPLLVYAFSTLVPLSLSLSSVSVSSRLLPPRHPCDASRVRVLSI